MSTLNFNVFPSYFDKVLNSYGVDLTWRKRSTGSSDPYSTGSTVTYGYGDVEIAYTTGSFKALVKLLSANDKATLQGVYQDVELEIMFSRTTDARIWDRVYLPTSYGLVATGSTNTSLIEYIMHPPQPYFVNNLFACQKAYLSRLIPSREDVFR